jgi:hypothetical protein
MGERDRSGYAYILAVRLLAARLYKGKSIAYIDRKEGTEVQRYILRVALSLLRGLDLSPLNKGEYHRIILFSDDINYILLLEHFNNIVFHYGLVLLHNYFEKR